MSKRSYHHGDLEMAIIEAAIAYIEEKGAESLSLRGIAKTCGVSATAIYRHFANKEALFAKIATEGFKCLSSTGKTMNGASNTSVAYGVGYVEFALDHPGYFAIMFGTYIKDHRIYPELYETSHASYNELTNYVQSKTKNLSAEEVNIIVEKQWALVHGLAILMSRHFIEYDESNRREVIELILNAKLEK